MWSVDKELWYPYQINTSFIAVSFRSPGGLNLLEEEGLFLIIKRQDYEKI